MTREEAIDMLYGMKADNLNLDDAYTKDKYDVLEMAIQALEQEPETVTEFADRCRECGKMRKGRWIYDKTIENWRCSKCNETPKTIGYVGTADFMAEHFKFCNHCGRRMVEPQESEEV